jgi:hypothetical protein
MNISMPIRHGTFVARFSSLAEEHERLARFKMLVRVAAELHPGGRFALEVCYPAWIRPNSLFLEQSQGASSAMLLADLLRLVMPSNKKRMDRRQCDRGPGQEGAHETIKVPGRHRASLPVGYQRWHKSDDERHPDSPELRQPLNDCCFVHVAASRFDRTDDTPEESDVRSSLPAMPKRGAGDRNDVHRGNVSIS